MEASADSIPTKSSENRYEVSTFDGSKYTVNMELHTCACRRWDLSGIPCKHAISAIYAEGKAFEDYVHSCYSVETYNSVYVHVISPMNGDDLWEKAGYIPPLPPSFAKKNKGRTQKERRFGPNEKPKRKRRGSGTVQRMEKQLRKENFNTEATQPQLEKESAAAQKDAQPSTQFEEEMTQHDCPPSTQEDDATSSMLPTTKQGRKMLARKRPKFANNPVDDGPAQEKSTAYTISSEINVVQSSAREPPISQPSTGFHS